MTQPYNFTHFYTHNIQLISLIRTSINIIINYLNLSLTILTLPLYKSIIIQITEVATSQLNISQPTIKRAFYDFIINTTTQQSFPPTIKHLLLELIIILEFCIYMHTKLIELF